MIDDAENRVAMDIAVYGGSFNPPHLGHREAVITALDALRPDLLLVDAVHIPDVNIRQVSIIKGDARSQSIAAASIIKSVRFMYIPSFAAEESLFPEKLSLEFAVRRGFFVVIFGDKPGSRRACGNSSDTGAPSDAEAARRRSGRRSGCCSSDCAGGSG